MEDINYIKKVLKKEKIINKICEILIIEQELDSVFNNIIPQLKILSGCDAVAIRFHRDDDYPYVAHSGFDLEFIQKENHLCLRDENGSRVYSKDEDSYVLECMCGLVIRGKTDGQQPFYTEGGSFWTNSTSALLKSFQERGIKLETRNYCNYSAYESVALIPIRCGEENMGLIQLNHNGKGAFTEELIECFEKVGELIGRSVKNNQKYNKMKKRLRKLEERSITDPLTGIYNRRYMYFRLNELIEKYKRSGNKLSVVVIDLDKFKPVNDRYGHAMGDELLKLFANILEKNIRSYDIACRYGGDEFVLVLDETSQAQAQNIMKRVETDCKNSGILKDGNEIRVLFSYGIAEIEELESAYATSPAALLKFADEKLLKAKKAGSSVELRRKSQVKMW